MFCEKSEVEVLKTIIIITIYNLKIFTPHRGDIILNNEEIIISKY
jgi:hypothetical protein